ncbi:MAG: DUF2203 domain-containing protein [Firmicutes bacterium]|jgi:hypothetical protein|nr:DUF2203 domain-containing protein [Bacillota bacterium]
MLERLRTFQTEARTRYEEMRDIREVGYRKDGNLVMLTDYQLAKREFDDVVNQANRLLTAINEVGCRVTDVEMGLVDFPSQIDGAEVYLCWQMDEPEIGFFHGVDEGYTGRRPLPSR